VATPATQTPAALSRACRIPAIILGLLGALVLAPQAVLATPRADAAVVCGAAAPPPGAVFSGTVLHVLDGRTFCVARGPRPAEWIRVTLPGAGNVTRPQLMAAIFARRVVCVAGPSSERGLVAQCRSDGQAALERAQSLPTRIEAEFWR
jgi:hypothetical protein